MSVPKRVQMSRQRPWRAEHPDAVIVDRRTPWGNPFKVGCAALDLGQGMYSPTEVAWAHRRSLGITHSPTVEVTDAATAVRMFRGWVERRTILIDEERGADWYEDEARRVLAGRDLACWCSLDQACHADVLLELANPELSS